MIKLISKGEIGETYCIYSQNKKTRLEMGQCSCNTIQNAIASIFINNLSMKLLKVSSKNERGYKVFLSNTQIKWNSLYKSVKALTNKLKSYLIDLSFFKAILIKYRYKKERLGIIE